MILKHNPDIDIRELDKRKEEIISKFKIDHDTIKLSEKQEEELKEYLQKEKEDFHREYYGRAYSTKTKNLSISRKCKRYKGE